MIIVIYIAGAALARLANEVCLDPALYLHGTIACSVKTFPFTKKGKKVQYILEMLPQYNCILMLTGL